MWRLPEKFRNRPARAHIPITSAYDKALIPRLRHSSYNEASQPIPIMKMTILAFFSTLLMACNGGEPEKPGNVPNPKLVELINASFEQQMGRMNPRWSRAYLPQASDNARLWLGQVDHVVTHCRYGPGSDSKFNLLEYDITLTNGELIKNVYTGLRCQYKLSSPLVMHLSFSNGQAASALTDGRERKRPMRESMGEINLLVETILGVDQSRRPSLYYPPAKTAKEFADEWNLKPGKN